MSLYECTFIVRQDATQQEVEKITSTLSNVLSDNGGKVLKTENWGLRPLAYEIKKNKKGNYVMLVIDAENSTVKEMERRMKLTEDVIRHLTVRIESFDGKDSIMLTANHDQEIEENI
jgi:small subunit ribosomal protein S6